MTVLPYLIAGWIFLIGVYGLVTSRNLIHAVGCLAVAPTTMSVRASAWTTGSTTRLSVGASENTGAVPPRW